MFCPYCGTRLDEGARFCDNCGHRLDDDAATTVAPPVSVPSVEPATPATPNDGKPRDRKTMIIVAIVVVVLALAVGVGFGVRAWLQARHAAAAADCAAAVKALEDADGKVADRLAKAGELAKTPDDEVADAKTVDALDKAIDNVDNPSRTKRECPADAKTNDLEATTRDAKSTLDRRNSQLAAVDRAASAVESSKAAKSFDSAKQTLSDKVSEAKSVLAESADKVDDGAVRDALQRSIDEAEKTLANATPKTAQKVVTAVDDVSKSVDAVKQAVAQHEAKLDANRCAAYAGRYTLTQGDDGFTLAADCSMNGSDSNGDYQWNATVAETPKANADGSVTWSFNRDGSSATATWRKPGSLPQWFLDSYGEYAPQMTQGKPTLELGGASLYVKE